MGQPLRSITIVGGGTAGWLTAAFLNRFCKSNDARRSLEITLIESPSIPIVGVGEASLPGMVVLLHQLGISESEFFKHTDATFKVAAHFINWNHDDKGQPVEFLNILNAPDAIEGRQLADYFVTFDPARSASNAGMAYVRAFSPAVEIVLRNLAPRRPGAPEFQRRARLHLSFRRHQACRLPEGPRDEPRREAHLGRCGRRQSRRARLRQIALPAPRGRARHRPRHRLHRLSRLDPATGSGRAIRALWRLSAERPRRRRADPA